MLSASGPTIGEVKRPSDGKHPERMAFIQCVGSRDQKHDYCSSVCCIYANKQAMLTIDHVPDCKPEVFIMDMRAQGKGFDAFYQHAVDRGVSFIRSRPSRIMEDPLTKDLLITWEDERGELHQSRYDMVVLSMGLEPARKGQEAAGRLGHRSQPARLLRPARSSTRSRPAARECSWSARSASPKTSPTRSPRARPPQPG